MNVVLSNDLLKYSPREIQIARLMAEGLSTKMIADKLGTAIPTVKVQRKGLIKKSGCKNGIEAMLKLRAQGLI